MLRGTRWLGWVGVAVVLAGCASGGAPKTVNFDADVLVAEGLNPDTNGRPSPLMIAVYQLKSADNFNNKDFFAVFDPNGRALGEDLVHREQMTLRPGESKKLAMEFDAEASFIGVVGAFSDIENSKWRALLPLPTQSLMARINVFKDERLQIEVGERTVDIRLTDG